MDNANWLERLMGMSDATWKRHASPWSVWTRVPILPLFALAIWARVWIGWWCLLPVALLALWTFLNPRAFPAPPSTRTWASMATFGERVWLKRKAQTIPAHHAQAAMILSILSGIGVLALVYGLVVLNLWALLCGLAVTLLSKLWFLDRMVWLYLDMKDGDETYRSWLY